MSGATIKNPKKPTPAIDQTKDTNILDNAWHASILAKSRIDKLSTRKL
jgi:hypothetical protein